MRARVIREDGRNAKGEGGQGLIETRVMGDISTGMWGYFSGSKGWNDKSKERGSRGCCK